jgi:2-keto-4-pentenoate hydratase/2-oxohepta-3-ene-1,7-dioic acid hydratase in catechol pathway
MKDIPAKDVHRYIYGYTIINDITARDIQKKEGQWFRAKSFDTFAPIGPVIVSKEEIKDPQNLSLKSYVNDVLCQDSSTSEMIFKIYDLISFISFSMTIKKGDLIATGTPAGVGIFSKEQKLLKVGDKVECSIEKIGTLTNFVTEG